jgi:hypothetical protein
MQKITYQDNIVLTNTINELLLINIDEDLNQTKESNNIKINGKININGEVNTINGKENFLHALDVDILLDKDQLIQEEVLVAVDDFEYSIQDNYIDINLIIKIDGLKELEPYFPSQEDQRDIQVDKEESSLIEETDSLTIESEQLPPTIEPSSTNVIEIIDNSLPITTKQHSSLLNQIFKGKRLNKTTNYFLHVVKTECGYKDIASIYNCNEEELKQLNNNQKLYIGKLVFIPKQ